MYKQYSQWLLLRHSSMHLHSLAILLCNISVQYLNVHHIYSLRRWEGTTIALIL